MLGESLGVPASKGKAIAGEREVCKAFIDTKAPVKECKLLCATSAYSSSFARSPYLKHNSCIPISSAVSCVEVFVGEKLLVYQVQRCRSTVIVCNLFYYISKRSSTLYRVQVEKDVEIILYPRF